MWIIGDGINSDFIHVCTPGEQWSYVRWSVIGVAISKRIALMLLILLCRGPFSGIPASCSRDNSRLADSPALVSVVENLFLVDIPDRSVCLLGL